MVRRTLAIAALVCLLAPALAMAQSPFSPLPQAQTQTSTTSTSGSNSTANGDSGGLANWQEIMIFLGGVILIVGIGYYIVSDARRSAPVAEGEQGHIGERPRFVPKSRTKPVRRAKGRQARASRKRNR